MASKRMTSTASPAAAKRPKSAIRHQIQVTFQSEASKLEFLSRLDGAKQHLFPTGGSVDNYHLLPACASEQGNVIGLVSVYIYVINFFL